MNEAENYEIARPMIDEAVSVSDLTHAIRALLTEGIGDVVVEGEISNYKHHTSGHRYFTLKDSEAQIACVMWRTRSVSFVPEDGMRVVIFGRLTVYPPQGRYQIDCALMRPAGIGDLHQAFEALKRRLDAKGLFAWERKRPLPRMPVVIGVITSPTGAAVQDIMSTIAGRFPAARVIFRPALVQGDGAAEDIALAIEQMNLTDAEVIIAGRGGGSLEDLWAFNTEPVAEAIYRSRLPVISAVGHETDVTIADLVADVRAATPTAAAVLATPVTADDLLLSIDEARLSMIDTMTERVDDLMEMVTDFLDGTAAQRLMERIHLRAQRIDELTVRYERSLRHRLAMITQRVDHAVTLCRSLHPLAPLRRGFAVVERNGHVVMTDEMLQPGETVTVRRHADISMALIQATTPITENTDGEEPDTTLA